MEILRPSVSERIFLIAKSTLLESDTRMEPREGFYKLVMKINEKIKYELKEKGRSYRKRQKFNLKKVVDGQSFEAEEAEKEKKRKE